jgi:RNA polymerase sigma-70 factor (ECF subfamily)
MSADLVHRARLGDREAFAELTRLYLPMITGVVMARLRQTQDVDDLVQETFLRALQGIGSIRDGGQAGSWLYGIAINVVRERWRERALAPLPPDQAEAPAAGEAASEAREAMRACIAALPESLRELFILRHIQGLSYKRLGDLRRATTSSIGERLWKARQLLRHCLERKGVLLPRLASGRDEA